MRIPGVAIALAAGLAAPTVAQRTRPEAAPVIQYRLLPGAPAEAVSGGPTLDLGGGTTDAELFNGIVAVRRQQSGRLLVATFDPMQIRVFDSEGNLLDSFGRKGQGPGEYVDLSELVVLPTDSIVVIDPMQRRMTVLGPDGTLAATVSLDPPFATPPFAVSVRPLADGTLLIGYAEVTTTAPSPQPIAVFQQIGRYTTRGVRLGTLGRFFVGEYFLQVAPPQFGGSAFWDRAFGRRGALVAAGQSVFVADATTIEVRRLDHDGRLEEVHRLDLPAAVLTSAMIARYRADALERVSPNNRPLEERRVAEMPYPDRLPAFRRLAVDARGRLWLQQYVYPGPEPNRWWVLDPATRQARAVVLPDRFVPHVIRRSDIVGVWSDADDVEHVRAYRLRP